MLGLPAAITACLFDMDGVLTRTATVHAAAWKAMFDEYLHQRAERTGEQFVPFDPVDDYLRYVDGRPRTDGVRAFLASRGIAVPDGSSTDPETTETVHGLGLRKTRMFMAVLERDGVEVYPSSVAYAERARQAGLATAVVSASKNCEAILAAAGIERLIDARVDGRVAEQRGLPGKPAPDTFLAAAELLGRRPAECAVFEDAQAGVAAGRAGNFGYVVGINRGDNRQALLTHGASVVVDDLAELLDN